MSLLLQHVFIEYLFCVDTMLRVRLQLGGKTDRVWSSPENIFSLSREYVIMH